MIQITNGINVLGVVEYSHIQYGENVHIAVRANPV